MAEQLKQPKQPIFLIIWNRLLTCAPGNMRYVDELAALKSVPARIRYITELLKKHDLSIVFLDVKKNNGKSAEFRQQGNYFMESSNRNLLKAVEMYNRALAHAEEGSDAMARAYANRSAVCYALKEYESCLENIEVAKSRGDCDSALLKRLEMRRKECLEMLSANGGKTEDTAPYKAKLSYPANPKIPRIVNGIELETDQIQGRHLVAKRNFAAGDILLIDEPYALSMAAGLMHQICHHCLRGKVLLLRPCARCTAAMFCSEDCEKLAFKRYHRFECPVLEKLMAMNTEIGTITSRIVCTAISAFDDNVDLLKAHVDQFDGNFHSFQIDWNNMTPQRLYDTIHTLATNEHKQSKESVADNTMACHFISELLFKHSPLFGKLADTELRRDFIRKLIYHHHMSAGINMRAGMLQHWFLATPSKAVAAYPLFSMMNHSCFPNIMRITLSGGREAAMVLRAIKAGEQINDNYGVCYHLHPMELRKQTLENEFNFDCRCEACRDNYPIVSPARVGDYNLKDIKEWQRMLKMLQEGQPVEVYLTFFDKLIKSVDKYYGDTIEHDSTVGGLLRLFAKIVGLLYCEREYGYK